MPVRRRVPAHNSECQKVISVTMTTGMINSKRERDASEYGSACLLQFEDQSPQSTLLPKALGVERTELSCCVHQPPVLRQDLLDPGAGVLIFPGCSQLRASLNAGMHPPSRRSSGSRVLMSPASHWPLRSELLQAGSCCLGIPLEKFAATDQPPERYKQRFGRDVVLRGGGRDRCPLIGRGVATPHKVTANGIAPPLVSAHHARKYPPPPQ